MRSLIVLVMVLAAAGPASAATAPATKLGMVPAAQTVLLAHERAVAKTLGAVAACQQVKGGTLIVNCYSKDGTRIVHVVSAHAECGLPGDNPCSARPVCTFRVTVSAGSPLKQLSTGVLDVCRKGWAAKLG